MPPTRQSSDASRKPSSPAHPAKSRNPRPPGAGRKPAARSAAKSSATRRSRILVQDSPIHGRGVYAARPIRKGERIIEYKGRIVSWKEADELPPSDPSDPNHTFLFSLSDGKRVIDASTSRNAARWINHSCDPNCETEETDKGRVFIDAIRDIARGEELNYDYCLVVDGKVTKKVKREYRCLCGAKKCRGTMLAPKKKKKKKKK